MALRIAPILLAVICSLCLYAADDGRNTADTLAGHPSETTAAAGELVERFETSGDAATLELTNGVIFSDGLRFFRHGRDTTGATLSQNVNRVFGDPPREFPFSPRLIRQYNYGIEIPDASLLSGEFLIQDNVLPQSNTTPTLNFGGANPNSALRRLSVPADAASRGIIVQTAGSDGEASFDLVLDADGHGINIIRRGGNDEPVPVLADCEGDVACLQYLATNADDEPIEVVLADCDDECETPATAAAPQPAPGLRRDAAIQLTPFECFLHDDIEGLLLLAPAWQLTDADSTTRNPASKADDDCGSPGLITPTPNGSLAGLNLTAAPAAPSPMPASESCSHVEPPLKAKVEHLLEAARHLAGAGYEEEAKLFRVEAEAIQNASTRLLTEKRQELEQLQREIAELEALTGQYQMIQIDYRVMEFSLPKDCEQDPDLRLLLESGVSVIGGQTCAPDDKGVARLLTGDFLAEILDRMEEHQCGTLKTIAKPRIVTTNGRPATLRTGGEFPILIPVAAEEDGEPGRAQIDWKNFGLSMQAVPFLMGDGKVRLSLETELSDRDFSNSTNLNGTVIPGLTTRRFRNDVEVQFGDTVAITCNSVRTTGGEEQSLLVLVTARQIEPPAERPEHD